MTRPRRDLALVGGGECEAHEVEAERDERREAGVIAERQRVALDLDGVVDDDDGPQEARALVRRERLVWEERVVAPLLRDAAVMQAAVIVAGESFNAVPAIRRCRSTRSAAVCRRQMSPGSRWRRRRGAS